MVDTIYIEEALVDHPRARSALQQYPRAEVIHCSRYTELFNLRAQNFRLQKQKPALILAEKTGRRVLPTPAEYQIGADKNFYFSHMLNCLYDCRYCFLQGMYQSANYVWFLNYEDFLADIDATIAAADPGEQLCFFSGYDCDSLALERMTGFAEWFLPQFAKRSAAWIELRTKSVQTRYLLEMEQPLDNVIVSYTLSPDRVAREVEHGAPSVAQRIKSIKKLTDHGWQVGLRFDPLFPWPKFEQLYGEFFEQVFESIPAERVHSATLGPMRFPKAMYEKIVKLYPDSKMLARFPLETINGQATFPPDVESEMTSQAIALLSRHLPSEKIFQQEVPTTA